jgi:hypothetical protein
MSEEVAAANTTVTRLGSFPTITMAVWGTTPVVWGTAAAPVRTTAAACKPGSLLGR